MDHAWMAGLYGENVPALPASGGQETKREADALERWLRLTPGMAVLDLGGGTGRHAVELARRGYRVTGVGQGTSLLSHAASLATSLDMDLTWETMDATAYRAVERFDAVLCLNDIAFSLPAGEAAPEAYDRTVWSHVLAALVPGGRFVLTVPHAFAWVRTLLQDETMAGAFDPVSMLLTFDLPCSHADVAPPPAVRQRAYVPSELRLILREVGFAVETIAAGTAGRWGGAPLELDDTMMLAVSQKPLIADE